MGSQLHGSSSRLKVERELRGWSQQYVAEQIGADRYYLSRWEHGKTLPSPYYREKLCALFGKNARELGFLSRSEQPLASANEEAAPSEAVTAAPPQADSAIVDPTIPPLPGPTHDLVGRQELLHHLKTRLCAGSPSTIMALSGLPGVGKTALATALAHDEEVRDFFQGGILWAGVGRQPDVPGILSRWGTLLGISSIEAARLTTLGAWTQAIRTAIGTRHVLIVIDDAWALEDVVAFQLGGTGCAYLVTTRFPQLASHAAADDALVVPELSSTDSMILLERLVPLVVRGEQAAAGEIAQLVGGLPLALLLTGNFLRVQTYNRQPRRVRQAIERLRTAEMRLHLREAQPLSQRSPSLADVPAISLHTLIAVSDQQLDEEARVALYALSVFPPKPNTFSEEAALAVGDCSVDILDALSDAGLLESYAPERYALHQTIADYASLQRSDPAPIARLSHYMTGYVHASEKDYPGLELESVNVLTALRLAAEHGQLTDLVTAGNIFATFLFVRGAYAEAISLLERVRQAASELGDQQGQATALYHLGEIEMNQGEYQQAQDHLEEGLRLIRSQHDPLLTSQLLRMLGCVESYRGIYSEAEDHLRQALELARQCDNEELQSLVLRSSGAVASDRGQVVEGERLLREGLRLARRVGKPEQICPLLVNLNQVAMMRGRFAEAAKLASEALDIAVQINYLPAQCLLYSHMGVAAMEQGHYKQAREALLQGLALARQLEHPEYLIGVLCNLGRLMWKQGDMSMAEAYLQEAQTKARTIEFPWLQAGVLYEWGELYLQQQRLQEARVALDESYRLSVPDSPEGAALARYVQSRVAAALNDPDLARRYGTESLALLQSMEEHYRTAEVQQWLATLK
ncbi:tetratricopeptide repeat protein [Dictyobacter aurantiacus]|uniref:HTH cro/C1-type domain-containing protein n=1 Tax=Dictyobacter aurantiacus TaxID=1936993 RepID=A0A401ZIS6_9CHLR|nr:tetratricopeptide repeat protein [Dictyobacter aurantiacus]GCE06739.1 hypothetical protein KDAU_40680 [Dictyobacter aurantiacus]